MSNAAFNPAAADVRAGVERIPRALGGKAPITRADVDDAIRLLGPDLVRERLYAGATMVGCPVHFAAAILGELREAVAEVAS